MITDTKPLAERLRHASTTASNDDLSKPGTEKRQRHADRVPVMLEAADALDAKDALLREAVDGLRGVLNNRLKSDFDRARTLLSKLTEATKP
jgi:hypothetical protein